MKKVFAIILASLFIAAPVSAADNTVYIREADDKIVYEASDGFDERFMYHAGMVPGGGSLYGLSHYRKRHAGRL